MIRVAVLDDHPAVLAGLQRLVERADDLVPIAAVDNAKALLGALQSRRADVVILDYALASSDGLTLCQQLKERVRPPAVVIYSAYAGPALAVAARVAGADALIDKRAAATDLLQAVRHVAAGDIVMPEVSPELLAAAIERLEPRDVPIAGMLLAGTSHHAIAETLATERHDIVRRIPRIVGRLRPNTLLGTLGPAVEPEANATRSRAAHDTRLDGTDRRRRALDAARQQLRQASETRSKARQS
jgi:DNA-binding NarL/FixJ family response regulator